VDYGKEWSHKIMKNINFSKIVVINIKYNFIFFVMYGHHMLILLFFKKVYLISFIFKLVNSFFKSNIHWKNWTCGIFFWQNNTCHMIKLYIYILRFKTKVVVGFLIFFFCGGWYWNLGPFGNFYLLDEISLKNVFSCIF